MRLRPRLDGNHADIVAEFLRCGCVVQSLAAVGRGVPDLLVKVPCRIAGSRLVLVEVKDGNKPPSARKLTEAEIGFHARFAGCVAVAEHVTDVPEIILNICRG